ncbi:hypothetical protein LXL04_018498 [Taraxacum kok-saghyz]
MGKKRSWFGFLKRLLICNSQSIKVTDGKKDLQGTKRRKWCFGLLTTSRRHYHAVEAPAAKLKEEQKQHTMALAAAMTAAAEAAVAAANAAAVLARLVRSPHRRTRYEAAIKIQSFYRSHLAWKALIGLRGVVKLQAVIRGEIVRRKLLNRLKNTQRSKLHRIRIPTTFDQISVICEDKQDLLRPIMSRRNDNVLEINPTRSNQMCETTQKILRFGDRHHTDQEHQSPSFRSRMSCSYTKRHYHVSANRSDETSLPESPVFPAYMAATVSFMAKARSLSTPRQRMSFLDGYCTDHGSSCGKPMLSSSSSFNGGMKRNYRHIHL